MLFLIHPIGNPYPLALKGSSSSKLLLSEKAINVPICQNKALVIVDHVLAGNMTVSNIDSAQFLVGFFPDVDIVSEFSVIFIVYYFPTSTLVDIYVYQLTYFIVTL